MTVFTAIVASTDEGWGWSDLGLAEKVVVAVYMVSSPAFLVLTWVGALAAIGDFDWAAYLFVVAVSLDVIGTQSIALVYERHDAQLSDGKLVPTALRAGLAATMLATLGAVGCVAGWRGAATLVVVGVATSIGLTSPQA